MIFLGLVVLAQNCMGVRGFQVQLPSTGTLSVVGPFQINRDLPKILPLSVRISKIQNLMGGSDPSAFSLINGRAMELGGYDQANGVALDLSWTQTRIALWAKALQPVCKSSVLRARFPYPASASQFLQSAFGRDLNSTDNQLLSTVAALSTDNVSKFSVLCTVVLSSLEFNSL
jgi:hypothetical protein